LTRQAGGANRQSGARRDFSGKLPPIVLVRKLYKRSAKKRANRHWTLKRMPLQPADGAGNSATAGASDAQDFEDFMQVRDACAQDLKRACFLVEIRLRARAWFAYA
jgi:hypothetical protein